MGTALDVLDVGSGEEIEQIGGQSRQQLRHGALAAGRAGSLQSRRELRLSCTLIEQVDVGGLGPAVL